MDQIRSLDAFARPLELNFRGKTQFQTICGSLITVFVYTTFILYSLQQGLNFAGKKNIQISNYGRFDFEGANQAHNLGDLKGGILF